MTQSNRRSKGEPINLSPTVKNVVNDEHSGSEVHGAELNLSPTVREASRRLQDHESVSAVAFARAILEQHSEYADRKASALVLADRTDDQRRPVQEWLQAIRALFDPSHAPELHGKLVIIGLSLLESNLRQQLQKDSFLVTLEKELKEPLDILLTKQGHALRQPADSVPIQPNDPLHQVNEDQQGHALSEPADSVPIQTDDPLHQVNEDQLGRAAYARFLAARIATIADQKQAYSIHLYAPWGAGKSTVLNFLRVELEKEDKWLVVEFNAWRHQHIHPPWWSLMDSVFQQSKEKLDPWQRLKEYWWRFSSGRLHYFVAAVVLAWILALALSAIPADSSSMTDTMKLWAAIAENIGKILALVVTIWAVVQASSRSLLLGSARAAQTYVELAGDPMNEITQRFNKLIQRLAPKRVAIFIDDLDRCQSSYVIALLEGIQTLFRGTPVVFVVAADRRWLNACFEEVYKSITPLVGEPGKPLGTLFLEKAFQFSTPLPRVPETLKQAYWQRLIRVAPEEAQSQIDEAQKKAQAVMARTGSEGEVMQVVAQSHDQSFYERQAMREAAVLRLAAPDIVARIEHALKPLVALLEPNPRAMKRLVNTYSVNRALSILSQVEIERVQLALWTILAMRWPRLVDYLEENPGMVDKIGQQNAGHVPEDLLALFKDDDVGRVVRGGPNGVVLDANIVRQCALIHA